MPMIPTVGAYPLKGPIRWGNTKGSKSRLPCVSGINNSAPFSQLKPVDFALELIGRKRNELAGLVPTSPVKQLKASTVGDVLGMDPEAHDLMCHRRRKTRELSTDALAMERQC